VNDQHFGYITKSLKGNLVLTVKAQWWKSGGQKGNIRALKMLSPTRICWRIHKQSMENLPQQRSFMCAEHYTHGFLHTGIYGIWNVLQGAGVYTLTTFHTIPSWWATTFLTWSEGIALVQWSFPIVCIPTHIGCNSPNTGMIFMHGWRPAIENWEMCVLNLPTECTTKWLVLSPKTSLDTPHPHPSLSYLITIPKLEHLHPITINYTSTLK
jgi:hypothetical protein